MIVLTMTVLILFILSPLLVPWPYPSLADPDLKLFFPFLHHDLVLGFLLVLVLAILLYLQQDLLENIGVEAFVDAAAHPITRKRVLLEQF